MKSLVHGVNNQLHAREKTDVPVGDHEPDPGFASRFSAGSSFIVVAFLLMSPVIGALVACIGFCDPDTCWHLALGKWMVLHHGLPLSDPFSSNVGHLVYTGAHQPLIQHEWLSEVVFYSIYAMVGPTGILMFTAVMALCSFVLIPALMLRRARVPEAAIFILTLLALAAASFRLWVRPEAFSFLLFSALLAVQNICQSRSSSRVTVFACYIAAFALMAVWVNCHILFLVALVYLLAHCLLCAVESVRLRKVTLSVKRSSAMLAIGGLATVCNPWNFKYWHYVLHALSSPVANKENGPLTVHDLSNPTFVPLCLFLLLVWSLLVSCRYEKRDLEPVLGAETSASQSSFRLLLPSVLAFCATAVMFVFRRMTPFAVLVLLAVVAHVIGAFRSNQAKTGFFERLFADNDYRFLRRLWPDAAIMGLLYIGTCAFSCYLAATEFAPLSLPSASRLFQPPFRAIGFLESHRPPTRMLNDVKFGSMMTWTMTNPPDIFVDGRSDSSFDRQLLHDYNDMRLCRGNWRHLLLKYQIGWVFFPPKTALSIALANAPDWQAFYSDDQAVVLVRRSAQPLQQRSATF